MHTYMKYTQTTFALMHLSSCALFSHVKIFDKIIGRAELSHENLYKKIWYLKKKPLEKKNKICRPKNKKRTFKGHVEIVPEI